MSESIVLAKNEGLKSDLTQQELLDRFHTLVDKELDGQFPESEKQELEMIEARLDAEDAEIYAPWAKYQQDRLRFLALQVKQSREISKKLDELLEKVSQRASVDLNESDRQSLLLMQKAVQEQLIKEQEDWEKRLTPPYKIDDTT